MEVESFENEEVAKILNEWFVSIKVVLCSQPFTANCFTSESLHCLWCVQVKGTM